MTPSWADSSRIVRPSSHPGRFHGTHATAPPQISVDQLLAVGGAGQGDDAVGMQVVDVRVLHQCVHRGVDRGAAPPDPWPQ